MKHILLILSLTLLIPWLVFAEEIVEEPIESEASVEVVEVTPDAEQEEEEEEVAPEVTIKTSTERPILGWTERVLIMPEGLALEAKLTTGSDFNILYAQDIKAFTKDKEKKVSFKITDKKGVTKELVREHIKTTKFSTIKGVKEERHKAKIGLCIGGVYFQIDFSLAESEEHENYMKIGRDALAGHFLIDPGNTKIAVPDCKVPSESTDEN